jgi:hypothetical protein
MYCVKISDAAALAAARQQPRGGLIINFAATIAAYSDFVRMVFHPV